MKRKNYHLIRITAVCLMLGLGASMTSAALLPNEAAIVQAKKKKIGKKKARNIALKDAGLKKSQVSYLNVNLDYEDDYNADIYEVEFNKGRTEYSYDINAYTGEILDRDIDRDDD